LSASSRARDTAAVAAPRTTAAGVRAEEIAESLKVSRATVYRALAEVESTTA
jgi:transposase